ncbi:MAG: thiamine-phosphate kinase [Planctomycetota bacterium]|jgi:thiamine-monophosphate kinase
MRESELLQHVFATAGAPTPDVPIPPGDDMAMVKFHDRPVLAAVDQVVGGRHVDLERTPLELVGRKAVTRSLSDVAAMAAKPVALMAAVTLPPDFGHDRATALFDAMRRTAQRYACPLVGGDIAVFRDASSPLVCSVAVLAEPGPGGPVTRSGARLGDVIAVTGSLGGSLGTDGLGRHLTFEPRIAEASALAETLGRRLHAMIDISDGLGRDASHLAEQSGVQIEIDAERIPCTEGVDWRRAMSDGEDYELCFAADGEVPPRVGELPVTVVGRVVTRPGPDDPLVVVKAGPRTLDGTELGWEHRS